MENGESGLQPIFSHVEPVLAVRDVSETIRYWHEVLGFPDKWTWGDPPNHGGVSWQKVFIQFSQNPELSTVSKGNSIWIRLQNIKALYSFHLKKNADIVAQLENKPWGMAEYTIREINGYFLHFAGAITDRNKSIAALPENIRIIERKPSPKEYLSLVSAVGWSSSLSDTMVQKFLSAVVIALVAENTLNGDVIGCAFLLGDHASFYYVKDVMVHPNWQGKRVGTSLMLELTHWLEKHGTNDALVALITGEALEPFYQQFGFAKAFSMIRHIRG